MRRWLAVALVLLVAAGVAAQEGGAPPGRDEFARLAEEAIRKAGEARPITYDAKEFRLVGAGGDLYLGAFFDESLAARDAAERAAVLERIARLWMQPHESVPAALEKVRASLLPNVRDRAALELLKLKAGPKVDLPWRTVGDHFAIAVVVDAAETMTWVDRDQLAKWGVTFEKALEIATANLRARAGAADPATFERVGPGVYVSSRRDYDASRVLLPDVLRKLAIDGDPVVAMPNRETLIVTGARDGAGLARLAVLARAVLEQPRAMNGRVLRLEGDTWRPFLPERSSPAFQALRRLEVEALVGEHREQKELLEAKLAAEGKDLFVATYGAKLSTETGEIRTHCVWTKGADSLLPRTETIIFMDVDRQSPEIVGAATWERVAEVAGDLLVPEPGLYPPRFRAKKFPTDAQLAKIGKDALPPR